MNRTEKGEGFPGQRIVVLPGPVVARARGHELTAGLLPTDVGYFPHARGHLRERSQGVQQAIFIYCVKGAGWCEMEEQSFGVEAGDLLVIPPGIPHAYGADERRPWTIHWFHAQGSRVPAFLKELGIGVKSPVIELGEEPQLRALFEEVLETVEQGYTPLRLLCASQALAHLLAVMVRERREGRHEAPGPHRKVSETIAYMKQHLRQALQLDQLASVAGLSRSQYAALFKQQTGYAPIDYFIRLRMHRACQLLDTTDLSIKDVAAMLGYEDPLYFSRLFRAVNAMPPQAYRMTRKG